MSPRRLHAFCSRLHFRDRPSVNQSDHFNLDLRTHRQACHLKSASSRLVLWKVLPINLIEWDKVLKVIEKNR